MNTAVEGLVQLALGDLPLRRSVLLLYSDEGGMSWGSLDGPVGYKEQMQMMERREVEGGLLEIVI